MIPFNVYRGLLESMKGPPLFQKLVESIMDTTPKKPRKVIIISSRKAGKSSLHALFSSKKTRKRCLGCGCKGAVMYNPWNKVTQCHNCGEIVTDDKVKVIFT